MPYKKQESPSISSSWNLGFFYNIL